jgi:hypothetical protein
VSTYPSWRYFPSYAAPPAWIEPLVALFAANRTQIDSAVTHETRMESNAVLAVIADGLRELGFEVEQSKAKAGKLPRPVFFGAGAGQQVIFATSEAPGTLVEMLTDVPHNLRMFDGLIIDRLN